MLEIREGPGNALSVQFGLRFDPAPVWLKGQLHTRQDLPIPAIASEMVELGLDNDTGKPRGLGKVKGWRYCHVRPFGRRQLEVFLQHEAGRGYEPRDAESLFGSAAWWQLARAAIHFAHRGVASAKRCQSLRSAAFAIGV